MAYQNTPVTNGYQVVQELANFAATVGWTVNRAAEQTDIDGVTDYYELTVSATGYSGYVTLAGYSDRIHLNGHRSYDSSKRWWEQPDQHFPYDNDGNLTDANERTYNAAIVELTVNPILSVHMFGGLTPTPYLYAAIEMEPGYYRHLVVGQFDKFGASLGGMFWDVSARERYNGYHSYPRYHRAPFMRDNTSFSTNGLHCGGFDGQDREGNVKFYVLLNYGRVYETSGVFGSELGSFFTGSPIVFNGRTPLLTPMVFATPPDDYIPVGTPPAVRYVDLTYFDAGDELTIGSETWKVFPWARKAPGVQNNSSDYSGSEYEASGMYGIAYLKD